jgi:hypothetical protein
LKAGKEIVGKQAAALKAVMANAKFNATFRAKYTFMNDTEFASMWNTANNLMFTTNNDTTNE